MNKPKFQKNIMGAAACIKRLMMAKKKCIQLTSNDTYFSDVFFSGVKTTEGVYYCGIVKTSHKGF